MKYIDYNLFRMSQSGVGSEEGSPTQRNINDIGMISDECYVSFISFIIHLNQMRFQHRLVFQC